MEDMETTDRWYYVIVRDPGTSSEQFVGFSDDTDEKFLPVFKTKEDARACFTLMPKDTFNGNYDTHAVIEDDIMTVIEQEGHKGFVLDAKGKILSRLG